MTVYLDNYSKLDHLLVVDGNRVFLRSISGENLSTFTASSSSSSDESSLSSSADVVHVTGTMVPDVTGDYGITEGSHNGYPIYYDGTYYVYVGGTGWYISDDVQDSPIGAYFYGPPYESGPEGVYDASFGRATGSATVA